MSGIGFLLLTYSRPDCLSRVVRRLERSFPGAPIVCHHDFSQCPLSRDQFPGVRFVWPHVSTSWGGFDTLDAVCLAMGLLLESPSAPEWTVILSSADFPIKPAREILNELRESTFDAYLHHELIDPSDIRRPWHHECVRRYYRSPLAGEISHPFSSERPCFAGLGWTTLRRTAMRRLLDRHSENGAVTQWFRRCEIPGEAYFQTVLVNERDLRIHGDPLRFTEWDDNASHPSTITLEHWPRLMASNAHFARKFDALVDAHVLDRLDNWLDSTDLDSGTAPGLEGRRET